MKHMKYIYIWKKQQQLHNNKNNAEKTHQLNESYIIIIEVDCTQERI